MGRTAQGGVAACEPDLVAKAPAIAGLAPVAGFGEPTRSGFPVTETGVFTELGNDATRLFGRPPVAADGHMAGDPGEPTPGPVVTRAQHRASIRFPSREAPDSSNL